MKHKVIQQKNSQDYRIHRIPGVEPNPGLSNPVNPEILRIPVQTICFLT
jgi:hypothetical protein